MLWSSKTLVAGVLSLSLLLSAALRAEIDRSGAG